MWIFSETQKQSPFVLRFGSCRLDSVSDHMEEVQVYPGLKTQREGAHAKRCCLASLYPESRALKPSCSAVACRWRQIISASQFKSSSHVCRFYYQTPAESDEARHAHIVELFGNETLWQWALQPSSSSVNGVLTGWVWKRHPWQLSSN